MFTLAVFAMGLLGGSLGVFSLIILETVVCGAVFFYSWSEGFVEALRASAETGAILTAGFICAVIALYLSAKFRFRFRLISLRQRHEGGLLDAVAGRDIELIKVRLARFRAETHKIK